MKIAFLTSGGVDRSGTERVIPCFLWLIERLVRNGDEVHVFVFSQEATAGTWLLRGAVIHNAGNKHPGRRMFFQIIAEHFRGRFDVIHTSWSVLAGLFGVVVGIIFHVPRLIYFGNTELIDVSDIKTARSTLTGRILLRLLVAGANRIAAQSAYVVDQARVLNISATRMPLGVDLDRWPAAAPRRRDPCAPARLLHVGSIVPVKDHSMLLDTALALRTAGIAFEIDVIGEDVGRDKAVQRQASALGLANQVCFHGFVPHSDLRPYFDRADLLIVTSRHEAGPLVALEAAVAGVPVVGTNVGHLAEWAPFAARVVDPRDSSALARAIIELLSDEDARIALASRAQERALAEDADATSRRFRDLYREMSGAFR